jgi:hypothetical protein
MPAFTLMDSKALGRLVSALLAIVEILHRWEMGEPTGEVPADTPKYDLGDVATAFEKILAELKASGPDGHEVYKHFGAIAADLRAAADALQEK